MKKEEIALAAEAASTTRRKLGPPRKEYVEVLRLGESHLGMSSAIKKLTL